MIKAFVETGKKRVFVGANEWPGWCRWGKNETDALDSFLEYGERYYQAIKNTRFIPNIPHEIEEISIIERRSGDTTTDFGAPAMIFDFDRLPMKTVEYQKSEEILKASWKKFDEVVERAKGKELRKGPRGGGRDLEKIIEHVLMADQQYLRKMAWNHKRSEDIEAREELERMRSGLLGALAIAERGELPEKGPRGGQIWLPRFFVRRVVWHILDHAWEIEDRILDE